MVDTHCHIDLFPDPHAVAIEAERKGIITIAVTNLPSHFEMGYPHVAGFKRVRLALGMHPLMVDKHKREFGLFKKLLNKTSYIGEVGLDFSPAGKKTKDEQIESFKFVLESIRDRPRFLSLHSRRAESTVLELLDEFKIKNAIFHWYSGALKTLDEAILRGHFFSVNTAMVQSANGKKIIKRIPRDRILTESDGPYVQLDRKPAGPQDMKRVVDVVKDIWNISAEEAEGQIDLNFKEVISRIH